MSRGLPFVIIDGVPVLAGYVDGQLVGMSVPDGNLAAFEPEEVSGFVSVDPAAVFYGASMQLAHAERMAAAPKQAGRFKPRGQLFQPLPEGMVSGYPLVRPTLDKLRASVPTEEVIRLSSLFAVSTIRVRIDKAEESFACFVRLQEAQTGGAVPPVDDIRKCFTALRNTKARQFKEVAEYAPTIRQAMQRGLRDNALRRYLAMETDLPTGLGLAKLSFTLVLLGQDCMCLDTRILVRMFGSWKRGEEVQSGWGKTDKGRISELSISRYEAVEKSFLEGNRFYDPSDPIGRARAQWMSWEPLGHPPAPATHSVWLDVVSAKVQTPRAVAAAAPLATPRRRRPVETRPHRVRDSEQLSPAEIEVRNRARRVLWPTIDIGSPVQYNLGFNPGWDDSWVDARVVEFEKSDDPEGYDRIFVTFHLGRDTGVWSDEWTDRIRQPRPVEHFAAEELGRREAAYRGWEHRRERDEFVVQNLDPELVPLWKRIGPQFHGTPEQRYRDFMQYVNDHPDEVMQVSQMNADQQLDQLIAQREHMSRAPVARAVEQSFTYRGVHYDVVETNGQRWVRIGEMYYGPLGDYGPFSDVGDTLEAAKAFAQGKIDEVLALSHVGDDASPSPPMRRDALVSIEQLAAIFLVSIEDRMDKAAWRKRQHDPRVPKIVKALMSVGVTGQVGPVLGSGTFGTACGLPDGRVLKLTSDPTETQASYVLKGKRLAHVVYIHEAWFVRGVKVRATITVDEMSRPVSTREWPMGVTIVERVTPIPRGPGFKGLTGTVVQYKQQHHLFPEQLVKMGKAKARSTLKAASEGLEALLRSSGQELRSMDRVDEAYLAEGVADALKETRSEGVYAIDVHGANVGYMETPAGDKTYKIFDLGSSSPPETPHAPQVPAGPASRRQESSPSQMAFLGMEGMLAEDVEPPWIGEGAQASRPSEKVNF